MDNQKENEVEMREASEEQMRREQIEEGRPVETKAPADAIREELEPLFENDESEQFRTQWLNIQGKFVDNPRESVREADELVASVLKSVTMSFHNRRSSLEKEWNSGGNASTEDLRLALKRYRSFFDRLLTLES
jgi:hypothetical protein